MHSGLGQKGVFVTNLKHSRGYLPVAVALDKQALIVTHAGSGWGPISPHCSSGSGVRGPGRKPW